MRPFVCICESIQEDAYPLMEYLTLEEFMGGKWPAAPLDGHEARLKVDCTIDAQSLHLLLLRCREKIGLEILQLIVTPVSAPAVVAMLEARKGPGDIKFLQGKGGLKSVGLEDDIPDLDVLEAKVRSALPGIEIRVLNVEKDEFRPPTPPQAESGYQ